MPARFVDRLKTIVSAEVSAFLDAQEDASQGESDTERQRALLRADLGAKLAEHYRLSKSTRRGDEALEDLDQKAAFALEKGREDLAKAALSRKIDIQSGHAAARRALTQLEREIDALEDLIALLADPTSGPGDVESKLAELERLQREASALGQSEKGA
ncbi:MAG: PspA/IM30 family protein [Pseudomonadota bacterium]